MDLFLPIVLFIIFCILFSICGWCCKKHREGTVFGYAGQPTVTVTTQHASDAIVPPYPVGPQHPIPVGSGPGFAPSATGGYGYQSAPYPMSTSPYPPAPPALGFVPQPMPMAAGFAQTTPYPPAGGAPYPPATTTPYPSASGAPYPPTTGPLPPSYNEAVGQPPSEPYRASEGYHKQSPYNPNY